MSIIPILYIYYSLFSLSIIPYSAIVVRDVANGLPSFRCFGKVFFYREKSFSYTIKNFL